MCTYYTYIKKLDLASNNSSERKDTLLFLFYSEVCPLVEIRSPHPSPQVSVSPPLDPRGVGATLSWGREGEDPIQTTGKKT